MDGEDGIETFSPKNRSHLVFDRGREAREGRAGVAPHVQQKVSFEDASVEGTVLSREKLLDQDSGEEEGNEADESLTEGPQVLNVNRHHVDFLLQVRRSLPAWCLQSILQSIATEAPCTAARLQRSSNHLLKVHSATIFYPPQRLSSVERICRKTLCARPL